MRHNSGIIGPITPANYEKASGVHDTLDHFLRKGLNRWPLAKEYLTITPSSPASYNEGSAITFSATLNNYLNGEFVYYTIETVGGTVNTSDFTDAVVSGALTVASNAVSITKTLVFDGTSEAGDAFTFNIREGSITGPIKLTSGTITINNPTFSVSPSASSVNEGSSVTWTVTTTNINNGTTLYYTISGVEAADVAATSGSFTINSNTGSFTTTTIADALTEGAQTMTANIRVGSTGGTVVATNTCIINDTSLSPTISPSATSIDESGVVTFTVSTTGLTDGTTLYWSTNIVSGTVDANDFTDGILVGSFTVTSNSGTVTRTIKSDYVTEGSESFTLSIRTGSTSGTVVATSATITINDTSITPTATVTPDVTSVDEGGTVTFTVNTTNFASGTLYWTVAKVGSYNIRETDFSDGLLSGTVTISGSTGTFTRTLANDGFTEGSEQFTVSVRTFSSSGTVVGTSSTITVGDTSTGTPEPSFDITAATFTVRRTATSNNVVGSWANVVFSPVTNNFWVFGYASGSYSGSFGTTIDPFTGYGSYSTDGVTWSTPIMTTYAAGGTFVVPATGTVLASQLGGFITRVAPTLNNTTPTELDLTGIGYRDWQTFTINSSGEIILYDGYSNTASAKSTNDGVTWANLTTVPNRVGGVYYWNDAGTYRHYISDWGNTLSYYSTDAGVTATSLVYLGNMAGYNNYIVATGGGSTLTVYQMSGATPTVKATFAATSGYTWQSITMITGTTTAIAVESGGTTFAGQQCKVHKINDITEATPTISQSRVIPSVNSTLHNIYYHDAQKRLYLSGTYGCIATLDF